MAKSCEEVAPYYSLLSRAKIIRSQSKPINRHTHEYRKLQELCLMILNREKHGLGYQEQKNPWYSFDVSGFGKSMFIPCLPKVFIHPRNKDKTDGIQFLLH